MTRARGSSKGGRKRKLETVFLELGDVIRRFHARACRCDTCIAAEALLAELRAALKTRGASTKEPTS